MNVIWHKFLKEFRLETTWAETDLTLWPFLLWKWLSEAVFKEPTQNICENKHELTTFNDNFDLQFSKPISNFTQWSCGMPWRMELELFALWSFKLSCLESFFQWGEWPFLQNFMQSWASEAFPSDFGQWVFHKIDPPTPKPPSATWESVPPTCYAFQQETQDY